jgi:murein DD-endopeptidase MepM/ murein hydrolase activator NlpD
MKHPFVVCACLLGLSLLSSVDGRAQQRREQGVFKKNLTIKPKTAPPEKKEDEFQLEEQAVPALRFSTQFEPKKEFNPVVQNPDTTKLTKGEQLVVENDEEVQTAQGDWVKIASYYSIWDAQSINPYNIDPKDFDDAVELQLYDPAKNQFWAAPLKEGRLTSIFGWRWGRWHNGVDLDLETGDTVRVAFDGIVRVVAFDGRGYGKYVVVRHYNGLETLYAHMSQQLVQSGQLIKAGHVVGLGGSTGRSTGSHLHYEVRYEGNAFTPLELYAFPENSLKSDRYLLTPKVWDHLRGKAVVRQEFASGERSVQSRTTQWVRVRSGQTLTEIANRAGVSLAQIRRLNPGISPRSLQIGRRIRIK